MFDEKAIFIWQDHAILGGDAQKIVAKLVEARFEAVYLHSVYLSTWTAPSRVRLAQACQAAGIKVYGSAAVYGAVPALEGEQAASLVNTYSLEGFVFDAESQFDAKTNAPDNARLLLLTYANRTRKPAAWCWWAFYEQPNPKPGKQPIIYHPKAVLAEAMKLAAVGMPMAYWEGETPSHAVAYLEASWKQWRAVTGKPIVVAGRAYAGDAGRALPGAILAYEQRARSLGAAAVTWWSMQHALELPGVWDALGSLPTGNGAPPPRTEDALAAVLEMMKSVEANQAATAALLAKIDTVLRVIAGKITQ